MTKLVFMTAISLLVSTAFAQDAAPRFQNQLSTTANVVGVNTCHQAENKAYDQAIAMAETVCQRAGQHVDLNSAWSYRDENDTTVSGVGPAASYAVNGCGLLHSTVKIAIAYNCR